VSLLVRGGGGRSWGGRGLGGQRPRGRRGWLRRIFPRTRSAAAARRSAAGGGVRLPPEEYQPEFYLSLYERGDGRARILRGGRGGAGAEPPAERPS